jgi:hypothetical protein
MLEAWNARYGALMSWQAAMLQELSYSHTNAKPTACHENLDLVEPEPRVDGCLTFPVRAAALLSTA